jgi:hypothetical protein
MELPPSALKAAHTIKEDNVPINPMHAVCQGAAPLTRLGFFDANF